MSVLSCSFSQLRLYWAAKGRFLLGEGAAVQTQAAIEPCRRPLRDIKPHARVKYKLI